MLLLPQADRLVLLDALDANDVRRLWLLVRAPPQHGAAAPRAPDNAVSSSGGAALQHQ